MVFGTFTRILFLILILVLIGQNFIAYLGQDINEVYLKDFEILGVENISKSSFDLYGEFLIVSESSLMLPVRKISFDIYLENQYLSSGSINSFRLGPVQTSKVGFEKTIYYNLEDLNLSSDFMVQGDIVLQFPFVNKYEIPFMDSKQISQIVPENILTLSDKGVIVLI